MLNPESEDEDGAEEAINDCDINDASVVNNVGLSDENIVNEEEGRSVDFLDDSLGVDDGLGLLDNVIDEVLAGEGDKPMDEGGLEDLDEDLTAIDIIIEEVIAGRGDILMLEAYAEVDRPNMDCAGDRPPDVDLNTLIGPQNLFEWRPIRSGTFTPTTFDYDDSKSGINYDNVDLADKCTESDCFGAVFDEQLVGHIAEETNRLCHQ